MTPNSLDAVVERLEALREDIAEIKNTDLTEIKTQVKATNGRVRDLEKWQARVIGALSVLTFLLMAFGAVLADRVLG